MAVSKSPAPPRSARAAALAERFRAVRRATAALAAPLSEEDCVVQSMPDASPVKWHLAHTTWFFETFVLEAGRGGVLPFHPRFSYLFNSYYESVGTRVERPRRGLQTRPALAMVRAYREHVEQAVEAWLAAEPPSRGLDVLELGLAHEEQHQELIVTDVKHLLSQVAWESVYAPRPPGRAQAPAHPPAHAPVGADARAPVGALEYERFPAALHAIGWAGDGFAFDNEGPRHKVYLEGFELARRPVTCGEFAEFVEGGGYADPRWWLSDGWDWVRAHGLRAPGYWHRDERGSWSVFTLHGTRPLDRGEIVAHVSYFEADAYARFRGARLPTEAEWEVAAASRAPAGHFADSGELHPRAPSADEQGWSSLYGDVWEWTASPYVAYPGFAPAAGALGEYNGKFMCNQMVLRGGSCATPPGHVRPTYRNFFPPGARWQFSGLRLARDARRSS